MSFLSLDNFKRVLDRVDAALFRAHAFRMYESDAPADLKALTADAMRQALLESPGGGPDALNAAVRSLTALLVQKHHLDKAAVLTDFDRLSKERTPASAGGGRPLESAAPPPPLSEAEMNARLRIREEAFHSNTTECADLPLPLPHQPMPPTPVGVRDAAKYVNKTHNLVISSLDRDWAGLDPLRYQYRVLLEGGGTSSLAMLNAKLRNIVSVEINYIIIPTEIDWTHVHTAETTPFRQFVHPTDTAYRTRILYENNYSYNFPYVLVRVDELTDTFYGTNDAIRQAFAVLTHSSSFDDVNGRRYAVLRPVPMDVHTYTPPLSGLSSLTLAMQMPSGALLNRSTDGLVVTSIVYSNLRPSLLQVNTRYFDRNEFYIGDYVRFAGFAAPADGGGGNAEAFVMRPEGHQVFDMSTPNADLYFNSFWIRAPGAFDAVVGAFVPDAGVLAALSACAGVGCQVLNLSLQNTLHLTVTTSEMVNPIGFDLV